MSNIIVSPWLDSKTVATKTIYIGAQYKKTVSPLSNTKTVSILSVHKNCFHTLCTQKLTMFLHLRNEALQLTIRNMAMHDGKFTNISNVQQHSISNNNLINYKKI